MLFIICFFHVLTGFAQSVWESRKPLPQGNDLESVAYGNNQFITVGEKRTTITSSDGVTWTEIFSTTKAESETGTSISNHDIKAARLLSITKVSNRLFIQIPSTRHIGKDLRFSLFNTTGRIIYSSKMKITARKFNFPISGFLRLSGCVYHVKITCGKDFEYYGSIAITR